MFLSDDGNTAVFHMPSGDFPIDEMTSRTHFEVNGGWHSSHSHCVPVTGRQWVGPSPSSPAAKGYDCAFCDKSTKFDTLVALYI